ncbi:clostripain-related cysteine peptidase [Aestuariivirga sp.]|uniref:clostripain-related cysteine peptidase n=1 Tax=Aestuariivirga sp. TaxID=2650926 RepID=UPI0039E351ED
MTTPETNIFLYMSAQNELSDAAERNVGEIARSVPLTGLCLYILLDKTKSEYEKTTMIYEVPPDASAKQFAASVKLAPIDKEVSSPDVFRNRLKAANAHFEKYTAGKPMGQRILVLWGHGGGLVLLDEYQARSVEIARGRLADFAKVLANNEAEGRFDIVAFDSCYMGMLETMNELRGCALYALSSSTMVDSQGLPYTEIIADLKNHDSTRTPHATSEAICQLYNHRYRETYPDGSRQLLMCDLSKIANAADLLNALGTILGNLIATPDANDPVRSVIRDALVCAGGEADYAFCLTLLDLLEYKLPDVIPAKSQVTLLEAIADLRQATKEAFSIPHGEDEPSQSPIIWAPLSRLKYVKMSADYNALKLSAGGKAGWASLWRKFHNVADGPPIPPPGSPTIGLPPVTVLKPALK